MKLKTNFKFLLILAIILGAMLLLGTTKVQASSINDYKCKIEKGDYIIYNNYFNTKDVTFDDYEIHTDVDKTTFNNIIKDNVLLLIEVPNDTESAREKFTNQYEQYQPLEIIELNNKKYVVAERKFYKESDYYLELITSISIEITRNGTTEMKNAGLNTFNVYNPDDYFYCETKVVSETGVVYGVGHNGNGIVNGVGIYPIPAKLDLSKCYVEYLTNTYIGETLKVDCLGNVPYVGKYGNQYKYKMSLKNVKVDENNGFPINEFSYKGSVSIEGFYLDPSYTINNETYVEQTKTNTSTKLKFDLYGKFKGTLKAEEIQKGDLIYNKVNEELKKYSNDNIYMNISNIYIEGGSFEGPLKLTFYVGEQYNGKYYNICHMKNWYYEFENFEGIVENGKIEIVVDSLSPFGISIFEKKTSDNTNQEKPKPTDTTDKGEKDDTPTTNTISKEKDDTPKTGTETANIIGYVLATTILSGVGIVALKKNLK